MNALVLVDIVLGGVVIGLVSALAVRRAMVRRRRVRVNALRARLEDRVATHLVGDDDAAVPAGLGRLELQVLEEVGTSALLELRGRERDRLAALLEDAGVVAARAQALRNRRAAARRQAAEVLGLIASPGTLDPLRAALDDPDPGVRLAAARGLVEAGDESVAAVAAGVADAAAKQHTGEVAELVLTLGARMPRALPELYERSSSDEVHRIVVATIGELRLAAHAGLLRRALREDDELAARAARGLGLIGDIEATGDLLALVADPSRPWFVRSVATTALGQLGDPLAVEPLARELAESEEWALRRSAAEALGRLGPRGEAALRVAAGGDGGSDARDHATAALDR